MMFDYMTVQEAAKQWGISERRVQVLCSENRIAGVVHLSRVWLIPKSTKKPFDRRIKNHKLQTIDGKINMIIQGENADEKDSDSRR